MCFSIAIHRRITTFFLIPNQQENNTEALFGVWLHHCLVLVYTTKYSNLKLGNYGESIIRRA